ncbi:MAG TPA: hypothetical protein DEP87_02380 [Candidatus Pacebacteria bacterium]|nr:hypothetical protein [Candidatus Paceibacterota bacterium]
MGNTHNKLSALKRENIAIWLNFGESKKHPTGHAPWFYVSVNRQVFGHWEGDSVESKAHRGNMHTEIERKTRFTITTLLKTLEAEGTAQIASQMYRDLFSFDC